MFKFVSGGKRSRQIMWGVAFVVLTAGLTFTALTWVRSNSVQLPPGVTELAYSRAARESRIALGRQPEPVDVFHRMGMRSFDIQDWPLADACLARIPENHPRYGQSAAFARAQALLELGRLNASETLIRKFLEREGKTPSPAVTSEDRVRAKHFLSLILSIELRFEERDGQLWDLISRDEADLFDTLAACFPTLMQWSNSESARRIEDASQIDPENIDLQSTLALYRMAQGRIDEARSMAAECLRQQPEDPRVRATWLAVVFEMGDWETLSRAVAVFGPAKPSEPWLLLRVRGQAALHDGKFQEAAECFRYVLAHDPANAESHLGLARAYQALKQPAEQQRHLAAAEALARIQNRLGWANAQDPSPEALGQIASLCFDIGLSKQCRTIADAGIARFPKDQELQRIRKQCDQQAQPEMKAGTP